MIWLACSLDGKYEKRSGTIHCTKLLRSQINYLQFSHETTWDKYHHVSRNIYFSFEHVPLQFRHYSVSEYIIVQNYKQNFFSTWIQTSVTAVKPCLITLIDFFRYGECTPFTLCHTARYVRLNMQKIRPFQLTVLDEIVHAFYVYMKSIKLFYCP